jgi:hypothetical protein
MKTYTKLFASIVTSTIWMEDDQTRIVWITMLAIADKNGEIHASIPGLARVAAVPVEAVTRAIEKFLGPDQHSRTKDDDGRRICEIDGGWILLNHAKYRRMASKDEQAEANAIRQRRFRNRSKSNASVTHSNASVTESNAKVTVGNATVTHDRDIADADADADTEKHTTKGAQTEPHPSFPKTAAEASAMALSVGCPETFAASTWNLAMSRGGRDAKGNLIVRWSNYIASCWAMDQGRKAENKAFQKQPRTVRNNLNI